MSKAKRQPEGARDRILSSATRLFSEKGFHPTSIRDIAAAAKINSQLIYYYFGDKPGLRRAVIEDAADRVYSLLQDARAHDGSALERMRLFIVSWVKTTLREAPTIRMLFRLAQEGDPPVVAAVRERSKRNAEIIRDLLQQGIDAHEIRKNLDPRFGAASLVGMVLFAATSPVLFSATSLQHEPKLIERFAAHTADTFIDGVAAGRRTPRPNRRRR